jgi:5-dehydro-4-deoxyglucarate dehydratase
MDPKELRTRLSGLMSFPVTPFGPDGAVDVVRLQSHVETQLATPAQCIFAACGTGEMFSLTLDEHVSVVRSTVEVARDVSKPVVAGIGYGTSIAMSMAKEAEKAGAAGVLVLPPYLVSSEQDGLFEHYRRIAESVTIGVIPYQRGGYSVTPETAVRLAEIPNIVGLKDGVGDTDQLTRIRVATDGQLTLMNGMPTAELTAYSLRAAGARSYSSAVLNFVPEIAISFFEAFQSGDTEKTDVLLSGFFSPFAKLREERAGFAVSLIKSGVNARAATVGTVRPPLLAPTEAHEERLREIIDAGLELLNAKPGK